MRLCVKIFLLVIIRPFETPCLLMMMMMMIQIEGFYPLHVQMLSIISGLMLELDLLVKRAILSIG